VVANHIANKPLALGFFVDPGIPLLFAALCLKFSRFAEFFFLVLLPDPPLMSDMSLFSIELNVL